MLSIYSLQFYLPDEAVINKDFMKAVLAGQKDLLKKDQVKEITVPKYDELSVKSIYPLFKKDAVMMKYFPDVYPKGKGPPREYFFNVLNTIYPDFLQQLLEHVERSAAAADATCRGAAAPAPPAGLPTLPDMQRSQSTKAYCIHRTTQYTPALHAHIKN